MATTRSTSRSGTVRPASAANADAAFRITLLILTVLTAIRIAFLAGNPFDLYPDEAQYWIWAQHPAWGYFSKPPLVAWMIAATSQIIGPGDLGVRLGSPLTYFCTSLVIYAIGTRLFSPRVGGWSAIAFATLPAVSLSSAIISTDVPLLLFWAIATYGFIRAREPGSHRFWWLLVGCAGGLGLLAKYAMGFWLLSGLIYLAAVPSQRRHLKMFLVAVVLSLAIYAPNLGWNFAHGFASYRHTSANANLHGFQLHPNELLEFTASQFAVFGPIFLGTFLVILWRWRRELRGEENAKSLMLAAFCLPTLAIMVIESCLSRAQPNWSAPVYVTASVLVVSWLDTKGRDLLVQLSVVLHVTVAVLVFGVAPAAASMGYRLPANLDPMHRLRGWHTLGTVASNLALEAYGLPLLGDDRETMAALIYYMNPHPFDMKVWNPDGHVGNGFEMEQSLPAHPGGDYLWLTTRDASAQAEVEARFQRHVQVGHVVVPIAKATTRELNVIALYGFKGYRDAPSPAAGSAKGSAATAP